MPRRPSELPEPLTWGPFSVHEARQLGVSADRLRARDLTAPFSGVRTSAPPKNLREMCAAYAVRMPPEHYFSHVTAAQLWGLPLPREFEAPLPLHVSAPWTGRAPRRTGVVGHRGPRDADVRLISGLAVLGPAETWCQLGSVLELDDLIAAGDRLFGWRDHLVSREELEQSLMRMSQQAGLQKVRRALRELRVGSNSPRETRLRLQVTRARFPEPELNGRIALANGSETWGDLVFRRWGVLMEFDGEQHRTADRQWRRDVDRLNDLVETGWLTTRVRKDSTDHLARLERNLRRRGWVPAAGWKSPWAR